MPYYEFPFDDDAFIRLTTIKNNAEPGTLKHSLIEFLNSSTVLSKILGGEDYSRNDSSKTHKMIIIFTNTFNEHYNLSEETYFKKETEDILQEIFKAWWVDVEAEIKASGRVEGREEDDGFEACKECGYWHHDEDKCLEEDDGFEACEDCGYWHHYEDKCPRGNACKHYKKV